MTKKKVVEETARHSSTPTKQLRPPAKKFKPVKNTTKVVVKKAIKPTVASKTPILRKYDYNIEEITRVVDGDSMWVKIDLGFSLSKKINVRLQGLDTPEKRTAAGKVVTAKVNRWFLERVNENLVLESKELDKFGRSLADIRCGSESLCQYLLIRNFARVYNGEKKVAWTALQIECILASREDL